MSEHASLRAAILAAADEIQQLGIAKTRRNQQQGFNYRGIDDIYDIVGPILTKHGLVLTVSYQHHGIEGFPSKSGGTLFRARVEGTFTLRHVGTPTDAVSSVMVAEAMDSGDKATAKAVSHAQKYWALQAFMIPLEGAAEDPDAESHEVQEQAPSGKRTSGGRPWPKSEDKGAALEIEAKRQRAALALKMAKDFIHKNDPRGYLTHMGNLDAKAAKWVEHQLTEDEAEWVAKVVDGASD